MIGNTFTPGPTPNTVKAVNGEIVTVPTGWILLPPGDAALTRRVKAAGEHWIVAEKMGRKVFSRGVWAPTTTIKQIRAELEAERSTKSFAKRKEADAKRREKAQEAYVEDFTGAVLAFLAFHPNHADLAQRLTSRRSIGSSQRSRKIAITCWATTVWTHSPRPSFSAVWSKKSPTIRSTGAMFISLFWTPASAAMASLMVGRIPSGMMPTFQPLNWSGCKPT